MNVFLGRFQLFSHGSRIARRLREYGRAQLAFERKCEQQNYKLAEYTISGVVGLSSGTQDENRPKMMTLHTDFSDAKKRDFCCPSEYSSSQRKAEFSANIVGRC